MAEDARTIPTIIQVREPSTQRPGSRHELVYDGTRAIQLLILRGTERIVIDVSPDDTYQCTSETVFGRNVIARGRLRGTLGEGYE